MKKATIKTVFCISILISAISAFGQKATLGIMDLSAKGGVSEEDADAVTDFILNSLFNIANQRYKIIAREQRDALLAEQKFALSDFSDDVEGALEVGKYLEAEYMIVGTFRYFGSKYYITLQLVDVNTTEVSGTARIDAPDYDAIVEELYSGVRELFEFDSVETVIKTSVQAINETVHLDFPNGSYDGEVKDGKPHGNGTRYYANGKQYDRYEGEFREGKKHGQGTYDFANGDQYVGEYRDDKRNGRGTYYFSSGNQYLRYVGEYRDDKMVGGWLYPRIGSRRWIE